MLLRNISYFVISYSVFSELYKEYVSVLHNFFWHDCIYLPAKRHRLNNNKHSVNDDNYNDGYYVCLLSLFSCVLLFVTLWIVDQLRSSVHGIFQARILEWISISFSRESSWSRDWTCNFWVSCIASGFFTTEPVGVVIIITKYFKILHNSSIHLIQIL